MRDVVAYNAEIVDGGVLLSRCTSYTFEEYTEQFGYTGELCTEGDVDKEVVNDWDTAIAWLLRPPAGSDEVFTVVFDLTAFTRALFVLLPDEVQSNIEQQDRIVYNDCKVFYVNGRYLGLTATVPVNIEANQYRREELNLQALKWWVSEHDIDPSDVKKTWELGTRIVQVLDKIGFYPSKLTSPVGVFADCYLGDARNYPTIFSFNEDWFEAQEYATEMMRYEWRSAYQVGAFESTHLYDLNSAYPSVIARLPSTDGCRCEHSDTRPDWATWGICYGEVNVTAEVSPLMIDMGGGVRLNPKGPWKGYFTTREIEWLYRRKAGRFKMDDGWFFRFGKVRPYREAMNMLYQWKSDADVFTSTIAKKMSQGVSGKLDEDRQDGKKGDYYNPILACMVRSETRIADADFIYDHGLTEDLIAVLVDSVLTTRQVEIPDKNGMGSWRYEGELPAIVLSKGGIWRPGKRPQGISYEDLIKAFEKYPDKGYYEFKTGSGSVRTIDLLLAESNPDRIMDYSPECGQDILTRVSQSEALQL